MMTLPMIKLVFVCSYAWQGRAFVPMKGQVSTFPLTSHLSSSSVLFQQRRFQEFGPNSTTYAPQERAWPSTSSPPMTSQDGRFFKRDVSQVPGDRSYVSPEFYGAASMRNPPVHPTEDWLARDPRRNERGTWKKPDLAYTSIYDDNNKNNATRNSSSHSAWLNASVNHPVHFADDWWTDHPRTLKLELSRVTEDPKDEPPFLGNMPYYYVDERAPPPPYFFQDPAAYYRQYAPYDYFRDRAPEQMHAPNYYDNRRGGNERVTSPTDQWWNKNNRVQEQQLQARQGQDMSRPRPTSQDRFSPSSGSRSFGEIKRSSPPPPPTSFFQDFRQKVTSPRNNRNGLDTRPPLSTNWPVNDPSTNGVRASSGETSTKRYEPVLLWEKIKQENARGDRDRAFERGLAQDAAAGNRAISSARSPGYYPQVDERNYLPFEESREVGRMGTPLGNRPVLLNDKLRQGEGRRGSSPRGFGENLSSYGNTYRGNRGREMSYSPYYDGASNGRGFSTGYQRTDGWSVRGSSGFDQGTYYGAGSYGSPYSYGSDRGFSPYYNQEQWGNERMSSRYGPSRSGAVWSAGNQRTQSNGLKQDMSRVSSNRMYDSSYYYGGGSNNYGALAPYYNGGSNNFYGNQNDWSSSYYYQNGNQGSSFYGSGMGMGFSPYYNQGSYETRHYSPFNPRGDLMSSSTSYYPGGSGMSSYSPFNQRGNYMSSSSSGYYQGVNDRDSFSGRSNLMYSSNSAFPGANSWSTSSSFGRRNGLVSSSNSPFPYGTTRGSPSYMRERQSSLRYQPLRRNDGWSVRKPMALKRDLSDVSRNLGNSLDDRPFSFRQ